MFTQRLIFAILFLFSFSASAEGIMGDNFHEVDSGKLYRSAQLSGKKLAGYIDQYGIKTVINLRGASPGKSWYDEELKVTTEKGVELVNIRMSAKRLPHREDLIRLIESFHQVERPILIHCQAGADRTGEAAALYQMIFQGKSKKQALKMLRFKYWHLRWLTPAKSYFIRYRWHGEEDMYANYYPCENEHWKHYDREKFCNPKLQNFIESEAEEDNELENLEFLMPVTGSPLLPAI